MESGPKLNFWRAPIDNDMYVVEEWKKKGLNMIQQRVDNIEVNVEEKSMSILVDLFMSPPNGDWSIKVKQKYEIYGDGSIELSIDGKPVGKLPEYFPRIGLEMKLPKDMQNVEWYGRGPGESYIDSKESNLFGTYNSHVDSMFTNYVLPQENGNRTATKYIVVKDNRGMGMFFSTDSQMDFSINNYGMEAIEKAKHTVDLVKKEYVSLYIDYRQHGLGSNSCGPIPLIEHSLIPEDFKFSIKFKGYCSELVSPLLLFTEVIEGCSLED